MNLKYYFKVCGLLFKKSIYIPENIFDTMIQEIKLIQLVFFSSVNEVNVLINKHFRCFNDQFKNYLKQLLIDNLMSSATCPLYLN